METNPSKIYLQKSFNKFVRTVLKARIDKIELERELKKLESNHPMRSTKYELVSVSGTRGKKEPMYDWIIRIERITTKINNCNNIESLFNSYSLLLTKRELDIISMYYFNNNTILDISLELKISKSRAYELNTQAINKYDIMKSEL